MKHENSSSNESENGFEQHLQSYAEASKAGLSEKAQTIASKILSWAAKNDPEPPPAQRAREQAQMYELKGDWTAAEDSYKRSLALAGNTQDSVFDLYKGHDCLGCLYGLLGRYPEAIGQAESAATQARALEVRVFDKP